MAPRKKPALPEPIGGGWYRLTDGKKVRGRVAAYEAAGLDPDKNGNRRSDAARQRRRKTTIEERRSRVAALLVSKVPYREIASHVGVSLQTVHADAVAIREEWKETSRREIEEFVHLELAALEEDEYRLRLRYQQAADHDVKNRIYDRILRVMARRTKLLGLEPADVRQIAVTVAAKVESDVVLRVGGADESYENTLRRAQGLQVVK